MTQASSEVREQAELKTICDVSDFSEVDQSIAFVGNRGRRFDGDRRYGRRLVLFHT